MKNNKELQRSADFSGETPRYPMDGNSNCTAWCRWETYRVYRDGQPGWDCRFIINATKTNSYPTYGQGSLQAGVKGHEEGTLEEKYIEIVAGETRTFYDQAVFVRAEAGADVNMIAYANILVPNVVSKGMEFTISVKRNLWYVTYNANGGTGAPSTQKKHFNNTLYLTTQNLHDPAIHSRGGLLHPRHPMHSISQVTPLQQMQIQPYMRYGRKTKQVNM